MSFLSPYAFLFALLAIPILVLYMLKLRRREVDISSTLLWQMLLRDRQANAPWQRIKRNLLLFLQLLILSALILALARPALAVPSVAARSLVVILDASASMNATDVAPTRFAAGQAVVRGLIDQLSNGARMTFILAGQQPSVLASGESDKTVLRRVLEGAHPSQGPSDWKSALALAAGTLFNTNLIDGRLVIVSDGGIPKETLPVPSGKVRYIPIGQSGENLAVRALAVRLQGKSPELFASVANYGEAQHTAILSFYANGRLLQSQPLTLLPGESLNVIQPAGEQDGKEIIYEARLSSADPNHPVLDPLSLDDSAFSVAQPSSSGRVLLASNSPDGNLFLEQILASLPGIQSFRALPDQNGSVHLPGSGEAPFGLYVLDGLTPDPLPPGNLLLINPSSNPLFEVHGVFTNTAQAQVADLSLTRFVDWSSVHIRQAHEVTLPSWAQGLVGTQAGPLVFAGEIGGRRVVVFTFDLRDSDLPLQVSYPILFSNLVNYLLQTQPIDPEVQSDGLQPGDSLSIQPQPGMTRVDITTPGGRVDSIAADSEKINFSDTANLGVYRVKYLGGNAAREDAFAVNLFNSLESNIRPAKEIDIGSSRIAASTPSEAGLRELWPWLAALALIVLLFEWWVYKRRQTLSFDWIKQRLRIGIKRNSV